jgi:hypothetical protein
VSPVTITEANAPVVQPDVERVAHPDVQQKAPTPQGSALQNALAEKEREMKEFMQRTKRRLAEASQMQSGATAGASKSHSLSAAHGTTDALLSTGTPALWTQPVKVDAKPSKKMICDGIVAVLASDLLLFPGRPEALDKVRQPFSGPRAALTVFETAQGTIYYDNTVHEVLATPKHPQLTVAFLQDALASSASPTPSTSSMGTKDKKGIKAKKKRLCSTEVQECVTFPFSLLKSELERLKPCLLSNAGVVVTSRGVEWHISQVCCRYPRLAQSLLRKALRPLADFE